MATKRASHEARLRSWMASHDTRSAILSHDAQQWSLLLLGMRHNGRRHHVGVRCETLNGAIDRALEEWEKA